MSIFKPMLFGRCSSDVIVSDTESYSRLVFGLRDAVSQAERDSLRLRPDSNVTLDSSILELLDTQICESILTYKIPSQSAEHE